MICIYWRDMRPAIRERRMRRRFKGEREKVRECGSVCSQKYV